jgi:hypothetical protein
MKYLFLLCLVTMAAMSASSQTKTLTNEGLAKYRVEREKGEREYRENYAKLGFPSPAELEKRREENAAINHGFVARLLDERAEAEKAENRQRATRAVYIPQFYVQDSEPAYGGVGYGYYGGRYRSGQPVQKYIQPGYFAGGQFWPTGSATLPRPLVRLRHR